jgi:hypothetical protein
MIFSQQITNDFSQQITNELGFSYLDKVVSLNLLELCFMMRLLIWFRKHK